MTGPPISVCMISGAEAKRIRRALESVGGWTSEIILVLNDDVTDRTDKIAADYGARVFREPWKGYAAQKNSAAAKATQPWILGLDADEVVSPGLRAEIQSVVAAPGEHSAFCFPRCTIFCGRWIRHGDWYPDRQTRLWRRSHAEWGGVEPHAKLIVNGAVEKLKCDLLHYSMENLDHRVRKIISYSSIFARQKKNKNAGTVELWLRPCWRFVRGYFLRLGFLDGWQGYVIARTVAFETFLRYAKLREAQLEKAEDVAGV